MCNCVSYIPHVYPEFPSHLDPYGQHSNKLFLFLLLRNLTLCATWLFFSSKTQWCSSRLIFSSLLFLQSILIHFCSTKALLINIAIDLNLDKSFGSVTGNCHASCWKCFPPGYHLLGFFLSPDAPSQSFCSSFLLFFTTQLKDPRSLSLTACMLCYGRTMEFSSCITYGD